MILVDPNDRSRNHYINERALTFSENDLEDPQRIAVSLVSGTVVMVNKKDDGDGVIIPRAANGDYEKWTLKGYSTKIPDGRNAAHYIFARLSRTDRTALIVFSLSNYNIDGSISTFTTNDDGSVTESRSEASDDYYYIRIGYLSETDGASDRVLTYDCGRLSVGNEIDDLRGAWNELFVPHYDNPANPKELTWIEAKSHMGIQGGVTMFIDGDGIDKPSLYEGLPVDGDTLYWEEDEEGNKVLKSKQSEFKGTLGALENVGAWADTAPENDRIMVQKKGSDVWEALPVEEIGTASFENVKEDGEGNAYTAIELSEDKKTLTLKKGETFATQADYETLNTKVTDFLEGEDTDTIINKWKELEGFLSGMKESDDLAVILSGKADKGTSLADYGIADAYTATQTDSLLAKKWTQDDTKISNWDTAYSWGDHSVQGYATQTWVSGRYLPLTGGTLTGDLRLKDSDNYGLTLYFGDGSYCYIQEDVDDHLKFYTRSGVDFEMSSSYSFGVKGKGISLNGGLLTYNEDGGYWTVSGDLLVTGGITMYANEGTYTPSTIMDGVVADEKTITNDGGVLKLHPDVEIGGGGLDDVIVTGTGNAVTAASLSDNVLTLTKGTTFLTSHQTIYNLTFQAGTFAAKTFDPNGAAATVNIPTTTSHISEGSNLYFTNARAQAAVTGGASTIVTSNLTASRALVSDASGKVAVSAVTSTELGYLDGVTSNVQTQLNTLSGKFASYLPLTGGTIKNGTDVCPLYIDTTDTTRMPYIGFMSNGTAGGFVGGLSNGRMFIQAGTGSSNNYGLMTIDTDGLLSITSKGTKYAEISYDSTNKVSTLSFTTSGKIIFGGKSGYANHTYYMRPSYGSSGATTASLYIQKASASSSSPTYTTLHGFEPTGNASHSGSLTVGTSASIGTTLTVNGIEMRKSQDDVLYLDANLVVRGGVTMYGTDSVTASTIMDGVVADEKTITNDGGVLKLHPDVEIGGGGLDDVIVTGTGNAVTAASLSGNVLTLTKGTTFLTSNLTASRALVSDASGKVVVSAVTSTELGYLGGVTSNVQTQLNTLSEKFADYLPLAGGTMTGTISSQSVIPKANNTWNLGNATYRFGGLYTYSVYTGATVHSALCYKAISATGWYRFASGTISDASGGTYVFFIRRNYMYTSNEAYVVAVTLDYSGVSFTQLSGHHHSTQQVITDIRCTRDHSGSVYFDFYYSTTSQNSVYVNAIGDCTLQTPAVVTETLTYTDEFTLVDGVKSSLGFVGDIDGNASTATKLATERKLWGRSFNGTADIVGHIYMGNDSSIIYGYRSSDGTNVNVVDCDSNNSVLSVGYGSAALNYATTINGYTVRLCYGASRVTGLMLDTSGRVGVGTNSPSYKLHVAGNSYTSGSLTVGTSASIGTTLTVNGIEMRKSQDDVLYLDANLVVRGGVTMYGTDSTSAPSILDSLPVANTSGTKGIASFDGNYFTVTDGKVSLIADNVGLNETELASYLSTNKYLTQTDGDARYLKLSGGTVTGNAVFSGGSATSSLIIRRSPSVITFQNSSGTLLGYLGFSGTDTPCMYTSGSVVRTLLTSGNYTSYTPILNSSSTHATNSSVIYAPSTAGTSGQVLKSNGSGAPTWVAQSSLSVGSATKATQDGDGNTISSTYLKLSGGTMTGTINSQSVLPKANNTYTLGNDSYRWNWASLYGVTAGVFTFGMKYYTSKPSSAGWYRIATSTVGGATGGTYLFSITRVYNNTNNESYQISVTLAYNGKISFSQISGGYNTQLITKMRCAYANSSGVTHFDIYYNGTVQNEIHVNGIGHMTMQAPASTATAHGLDNSVEFSLGNGCVASGVFTGTFNGKATSAASADNSTLFAGYGMRASAAFGNGNIDAMIMYKIDATSLSTSNFYPVTFSSSAKDLKLSMYSTTGGSALAYNQNTLDFLWRAQGWNDTPKSLTIFNYNCFSASEMTIGCLGYGQEGGVRCIWVRGGLTYYITSNQTPTLRTSTYTSGNEVFTVGTALYGGTNTKVTVVWTPQTTSGVGTMWNQGNIYAAGASTDVITLKRTTSGGGAFVRYFADNQSTYAWRAGVSSSHVFQWGYMSSASSSTVKLSLDSSGTLTTTGNILPATAASQYLGTYGSYFQAVNANLISSGAAANNLWLIGGNGTSGTTGIVFARNATGTSTGEIARMTDTTFYPYTTNSMSLGSSSYAWKNLYAGTVRGVASSVMWIGGMTSDNAAFANRMTNTNGNYHPILYTKTYSGNVVNFGGYVDNVGFYGYYAGRTANGTDWRTVWNTSNGQLEHSTSMTVGGNLLVKGGITMYSDIRKKTKLRDVELTLDEVADAPLIEHYYNADEKKTTHVGSVAQYWAGLNDWFCKKDNEGFYTMEIQNAALASSISVARQLRRFESETDRRIRLLEEENEALKKEIEQLKTA